MYLCLYPTNGLVSTIAPDHQVCMLQLHLTSSHVLISCILSAYMSVTVSSYQYPCILHLHPISHVCINCIRPFAMSLTAAHKKQSCLLNLHLQVYMSETPLIFVIAISNHLCCLLHLHQTSIVVIVVTVTPDQQSRWKRTSAACRYPTQALLFFLFFGNFILLFIYKFPADFFRILIQKRYFD